MHAVSILKGILKTASILNLQNLFLNIKIINYIGLGEMKNQLTYKRIRNENLSSTLWLFKSIITIFISN